MVTTLVSVALFLRWGAFGSVDTFWKRNLEKILLLTGVVFFVLSMLFAAFQVRTRVFLFICPTGGTAVERRKRKRLESFEGFGNNPTNQVSSPLWLERSWVLKGTIQRAERRRDKRLLEHDF